MTTDPIGIVPPAAAPTSTTGIYTTGAARSPSQSMDSEVFMKLLVTQLRNQDPSAPMDSNAMIAQTTQLSMMEKMTQLSTTSTEDFSLQMRVAAANFVGKQVTYTGKDGATVSGIAKSVSFAGSVPQVSVGGVDVALDLISGITTASA
ncbi:flagellar hook assembly protein FlgD [Lacisediminihabitans sp.]|jgi:flagellar basal-body rod modification protein FlgD|uniref:flagellar hook assembly protein FlgD n=1 Tax=Lacisediminihabitans sp. TaxID=2787631 RepID=UPI002F94C055